MPLIPNEYNTGMLFAQTVSVIPVRENHTIRMRYRTGLTVKGMVQIVVMC
jgi:hypothetical protein